MENVGDTYPVCLACGAIGTLRTKDGDECPECAGVPLPEVADA